MKTQSDLRAEHSVNELEPVIRKAFDEQTPFKSIYKYEEVIRSGKIKNLHDYVYGVDFYFMDGDKEVERLIGEKTREEIYDFVERNR